MTAWSLEPPLRSRLRSLVSLAVAAMLAGAACESHDNCQTARTKCPNNQPNCVNPIPDLPSYCGERHGSGDAGPSPSSGGPALGPGENTGGTLSTGGGSNTPNPSGGGTGAIPGGMAAEGGAGGERTDDEQPPRAGGGDGSGPPDTVGGAAGEGGAGGTSD